MTIVADLGDSSNPLGIIFWYEFAGFAVAMSLVFIALISLFSL